jgi:hypothetical protein
MNRKGKIWFRQGAGILMAMAFGAAVLAPSLRADDGAPAARAVRLSSVDGKVQLVQGNQVLADEAVANTPLFEGTQVVTGEDGRAEIQFEDGAVARVSPSSSLTLKVLRGQGENSDAEMVMNRGLGYFEMSGDNGNGRERVRFGDTLLTASGFTVVRIGMDKAPGEVAVFSGNAHLESGSGLALDLHGGESVALNATDTSQYKLAESIEPDSWDAWNADRDQALTTQASSRTAASKSLGGNNPAWSDLDASGSWYNVPNQGYVWSPYEAANPGFDPYGVGYWVSSPGYGYVWASGYPWGYMPFQCGAWNYFNEFGWGWAPGGMCQPWWGGGYGGGGWGYNIGYTPPRYRFPVRPRPRNPRPMGGAHPVGPEPVIAVNRRLPGGGSTMLPVRDRLHPVTIGGIVAEPVRPVSNRPGYNHMPVFSGNHPAPVVPGAGYGNRQGYIRGTDPGANGRSGYWATPRPVGSAPAPNGGTYQRQPAPGGSYGGSRPAGGSGARPSSGGVPASGGGVRSSGGGSSMGGGGGGGSRSSAPSAPSAPSSPHH